MAEAYGLLCCPSALVPESELSHSSEAQHCFILKLSHPSGKNAVPLRSTEKPFHGISLGYKRSHVALFFSAKRGVFASDDVFSCEATSGEVRAGARACSQAHTHDINTKAQSAKTSAEGFCMFLFTSET